MTQETNIVNSVVVIEGVRAYIDENNTAWINLEDAARGLGFIEVKNGVEYVRWRTIHEYLRQFNFSQEVAKNNFIPENIFYRLAMKAKNEVAEKFQSLVADEIIPSIRKTGKYEVSPKSDVELVIVGLQAANRIIDQLRGEITTLKPKAEAYNILLETGGLVRFRDLVQKLRVHFKINERAVHEWLIENRWFYRIKESDNHSRFKPFTSVIDAGYVRVKDEIYKNYPRLTYFFTRLGEEVLMKEFSKEFSLLKAESMNLFYSEE